MRTTIDLPDDLHAITTVIARDRGTSLSATVADLVRQGLQGGAVAEPEPSDLPAVRVGRAITAEDVRSLDDDG